MSAIFSGPSTRQVNLGLTLLRVVLGSVFVAHGAQKLFVFGFAGVAGAFGQMGIPLASVAGPVVGLMEFFGGLALIAGLLTRPAALGLAITMLGAIYFAHWPAGFFLPNGYEFVLTLFAGALSLAITGAGAWSLDALIASRGRTAVAEAVEQPRAGTRRAA
ncbi:MAG TPA: DoxX family protein [Longimicrobiales bacterium]|nr:DoxX family protein [Longimicrobiales bacterium]